MDSKWENDEVVQRFREYLRIPSVHPDVDYGGCVKFLEKQANLLDLPVFVKEFVPKKPVVVITWEGVQPELPSILLNSHMDVVPVNEASSKERFSARSPAFFIFFRGFKTATLGQMDRSISFPPFEAVVTDDGFIYGRGTQDMKSVGMMYLEAVRRLKDAGVRLKRTVHISFVPDEEIGGLDGMGAFSKSPEFKQLNIGFALDESSPHPHPKEFIAFHQERTSRQITVTCKGEPGHGSLLLAGTAGEKLHYIMDKFMNFRAGEMKKAGERVWFGDVTTINLTQISGGVQINVLPETLTVSFDIRIAPDVDHDEFENMISRWCEEAGEGVSFEYILKNPQVNGTKTDGSVSFWSVMQEVVNDMGYSVRSVTCPGATDMRYIRAQGIPGISFSPLLNSPILLHANDEKLHIDVFKIGIDVMEKVVQAIGDHLC